MWTEPQRPGRIQHCVIRDLGKEGKEGEAERAHQEIMAKNSPNMAKSINRQM